jgi:hypothetical protein
MISNIQQIGTTQTGVKNVFSGAEIFTLVAQSKPFMGVVRINIAGAAGAGTTNWIIQVQQGLSTEEWSGQTQGYALTTITLDDVFFNADEAITITLENDQPLDTLVTVTARLFTEAMPVSINASAPVVRTLDDTSPITFSFFGPSLTLVGTRSINNAAFVPVSGAISYLRAEGGNDLYTLDFNSNDRPTGEGTVRYRFVKLGWVSGDLERFVTLRTTISADANAGAVYNHFTTGSRADAFKADVTALALEATAQEILEVADDVAVGGATLENQQTILNTIRSTVGIQY